MVMVYEPLSITINPCTPLISTAIGADTKKMKSCKVLTQTLIRTSLSSPHKSNPHFLFSPCPRALPSLSLSQSLPGRTVAGTGPYRVLTRRFSSAEPLESAEDDEKSDTMEELLNNGDDVSRLMKMERRNGVARAGQRWFPYLDRFKCGDGSGVCLSSGEVLEAVGPYIMEERKERFRSAVKNRSYSVCLVVEGLSDFGNVSATFRSADALGFQSVHVVSCDSSKRYRDNRHVSMGAEKWLDIELWSSTQECFQVLKSRGYRIATTHVGMDAVSIYDMDWSCPTAIVVGNENRGISDEALELSDLHCSIPMKGMVDSFNVSVAAGILMHHAVCERISRLMLLFLEPTDFLITKNLWGKDSHIVMCIGVGYHGDLTSEESQILLAEFSLRHSKSAISIAHEYAKRKDATLMPKL